MVASVTRICGIVGQPNNERCMPLEAAIEAGRHLDSITPFALSHRDVEEDASREDYLAANVRVADQVVSIENHVGCEPGRDSSGIDTVFVVVDCLTDQAQRCANCILNLPSGEAVQQGLKRDFGRIATS